MIHEYKEDEAFFDDMTFGEYFRKKRRLLGINQMDFAEIIGINQETISRWESGKSSPPFEKAREIIEILGGEIKIKNIPDEESGYPIRENARINELVENYIRHGVTQGVI